MKKRRGRGTLLLAGMLAMIALIVLAIVAKGCSIVRSLRLKSAVEEAAASTLGVAPTTSTIIATRAAIKSTAKEHGIERPIILSAIERRLADGRAVHIAAFELCADGSHVDIERALPELLDEAELRALERQHVGEHTDTRWKHHHH
ncbi:MAG: hypothetical protein KF878_01185 [Planctomycetes bacterium]|nr:hypothetical protein [Planctomycetota bacterium]MCW8138996.1 hypothetical protein [Planctomycetota bacterium]